MSFLAALGAIAGATGSAAGNTGWMNYSSNASTNKKILKQNIAAAKTLALESPSWNVQGLRDAGINPILAANGGNLTSVNMPNGGLSSSTDGIPNPVNDYLINKSREEQLKIQSNTSKNLEAQSDNLRAQNDKIKSEIAVNAATVNNINQDTLNKANTRGLTGLFGAANQVGQDAVNLGENYAPSVFNSAKNWVVNDIKATGNQIKSGYNYVKSLLNRSSPASSSAKEVHSVKKAVMSSDEMKKWKSNPRWRH